MIVDPDELRSQLASLREIRAQGVRSTRFGTDETEFRSDAELASAISDLEHRIARLDRPASRIVNLRCRKGY